MKRDNDMRQGLPQNRPSTHPQHRRGRDGGGEQLEFQVAVAPTVSDHIAAVYGALQKAVERFGGMTELAVAMNKGKDEVSRRVRRVDDTKGDIQRAYVDYLGFIATHAAAREEFLAELAREWGFKRPELAHEPTEAEQLRALKAELRASGDLGDDVMKRAASRAGFDARAFRK